MRKGETTPQKCTVHNNSSGITEMTDAQWIQSGARKYSVTKNSKMYDTHQKRKCFVIFINKWLCSSLWCCFDEKSPTSKAYRQKFEWEQN